MGVESLTRQAGKLYEEDFVEWASETARLLRAGRLDEIDIENLAEEIEAMAGRDKREVLSRLRVLILHLLKWQQQPQKRTRSWRSSIAVQRAELSDLLEQSPSLKRVLVESAPRAYADAIERASIETGLPENSFPRECPFSPDQLLDRNFLPGSR